ncbi:MAG TPA: hypothetical protein VFW48_05550 [Solirubrobacterales bacterium]|nr:hypothetical protein [Solirubrobacterales bacterium]
MASLYGFEVKTELPLERLNAAAGTRGELTIDVAREPLPAPRRKPVSTLTGDDGRCFYASYELGDRCLLGLPPSGEFLLDPGAARLTVGIGDGDEALREHRIVSSAACTLLAMRGDLVLHASAVAIGDRAVLFCGPTGRGKSTLALALGEAGHGVLSEDGIAIDLERGAPVAFPGARGIRVRSSDADGGRRTDLAPDPGPSEPPPCPVAAVVLLGERGGALTVEPLEAARALALLTPNLTHSGGRGAIAAAFGRLAHLLHTVPAFRASLPEDLDSLPSAAAGLLDGVASHD